MKHLFTLLLLCSTLFAYAQFRMVGNVSGSWTTVNDSTYTGTVNFQSDLTGQGYLATQIADTFKLFTPTEQMYLVDSVWGQTFSSASMRVIRRNGAGSPIGQCLVFNPDGRQTIPQASFGSTGATAQMNAAVDAWNARQVTADTDTNVGNSNLDVISNRILNFKNVSSMTFDSLGVLRYNRVGNSIVEDFYRLSDNNIQNGNPILTQTFYGKRNGGYSSFGGLNFSYNGDSTTRYGNFYIRTNTAGSAGGPQFYVFSRAGSVAEKFTMLGSGANYLQTLLPFAENMSVGNRQDSLPDFGVGTYNTEGSIWFLAGGLREIAFPTFPNSRNDTSAILNVLSTTPNGGLQSNLISEIQDGNGIYTASGLIPANTFAKAAGLFRVEGDTTGNVTGKRSVLQIHKSSTIAAGIFQEEIADVSNWSGIKTNIDGATHVRAGVAGLVIGTNDGIAGTVVVGAVAQSQDVNGNTEFTPYALADDPTSTTDGDKEVMTWTRSGSTTTAAHEKTSFLNAANNYTLSDSTQIPANWTKAVRKLVTNFTNPNPNYSLEGDSVIVFSATGVYSISYGINSYDDAELLQLNFQHRPVPQAGSFSNVLLASRSGVSQTDQIAATGTFIFDVTSLPASVKIAITNFGTTTLAAWTGQINIQRIY